MLHACSLIFNYHLCSFPIHCICSLLSATSPLTFSLHPVVLHFLFFNPHSPQEVASPCPPSLLLLPFFLFHIWSGSCGWPGFSGVGRCGGKKKRRRRRRWLSFEEAINCKAQGTVKEKKRFDTKCALLKKKKKFEPNLLGFSQSIYHTVSLCTIKLY